MQVGLVVPRETLDALGGAARVWNSLFEALAARPEFEPIMISEFATESDCPSILEGYARFADLDVAGLDVVIATKYPAWVVDHPRVVVWMQHPLRGLYDLYPPDLSTDDILSTDDTLSTDNIGPIDSWLMKAATDGRPSALRDLAGVVRSDPQNPAFTFPGPLARNVVTTLDHRALKRADRVLTISRTVASRAGYFPEGVHPRAVLHPQSLEPVVEPVEPGRLFTASRLDPMKRIDLIIEAVKQNDLVTEFRIAGSGPDEQRLMELASDDARISFLGVVSDAQLAVEYARAAVVPFVPRDEDFGLVTLEAWAQSRPVVTVSDSGGVAEMVVAGETGLVAEPNCRSLSAAIDSLLSSPSTANTLGELGRNRSADLSWDRVVSRLLRRRGGHGDSTRTGLSGRGQRSSTGSRPRVVVVSSEEVGPGKHGGQIRARELYGSLRADVRFVSLGTPAARGGVRRLSSNAVEIIVPRSRDHLVAERQLSEQVGVVAIDVVADRFHHLTPDFGRLLESELAAANVVVMSQPYLASSVTSLAPAGAFVVYDAQNVEADLKAPVFGSKQARRFLYDDVTGLEATAVSAADLVVAVCEQDRLDLAARYGEPRSSVVISNGVRVCDVPFTGAGRRVARQLKVLESLAASDAMTLALFLGSLHPPNVEAALQIVEEATAQPDRANGADGVHVMLAGGHVRAVDAGRLSPQVHSLAVLGKARKLALLSSCGVALNPVTSGSGSNLKTVEYLAAGCPVVSTEFGSRGFDDLSEAVVFAEPDALLGVAAQVARDPRGSNERAVMGRRLVERSYDWGRLAMTLEAELGLG